MTSITRFILTMMMVLFTLLWSGCSRPQRSEELPKLTPTPTPLPTPTPTPEPTPTPLPEAFVPRQELDTAKIYNGIRLHSSFTTEQGDYASKERKDEESYTLELKLNVRVPKPNESLEELSSINPELPKVLPGLKLMLENAKVSNFWHGLYKNKTDFLQARLNRLDTLLTRHNFFDTETILEMNYPETGRKVLLIQSDMDVNGDGSDGDRMLKVDQTSSTFQPFTSYRWKKQTPHPNEFLEGREKRLAEMEIEFKQPGLTLEKNRALREGIQRLKTEIAELKTTSYLLSRADPSIVLPGFMFRYKDLPYAPKIGDYALAIYGDRLYPAIVGDAGPSNKTGEASLRICREIDPTSGVFRRPVSDLKVTYLVFPNSGDKPWGPPDLEKWYNRCAELLAEVGGYGGVLHAWEDITVPAPTPTPEPTPEPILIPEAVPAISPEPVPEPSPESVD